MVWVRGRDYLFGQQIADWETRNYDFVDTCDIEIKGFKWDLWQFFDINSPFLCLL